MEFPSPRGWKEGKKSKALRREKVLNSEPLHRDRILNSCGIEETGGVLFRSVLHGGDGRSSSQGRKERNVTLLNLGLVVGK
jgi:hypothetical protein